MRISDWSSDVCSSDLSESAVENVQTEIEAGPRGRIVAMDSAYHVLPENRDRDVVINASYCGVLPVRFIGEIRPRGAIGVDCGVGTDRTSVGSGQRGSVRAEHGGRRCVKKKKPN